MPLFLNVRQLFAVFLLIVWTGVLFASAPAAEPPALNPFGPRETTREDAKPGYIEMSDGKVISGEVYLTRDHRLKIYDATMERQREIPLRVVKEVEATVKKEWMEKEWRFKELANDEKYYTGREYPAREYLHTITLHDGRKITGPLSGIVYVKPEGTAGDEPMRFMLHKRQKGPIGSSLKSLFFVKQIKLGDKALEEGSRKTRRYRPSRPAAKQPSE